MKTYTVALIGCGKIGAMERFSEKVSPGSHLGAWLGHPQAKVVALVDPSEDALAKAKARAPEAKTYRSVEELFADAAPDIVSIATPAASHMKNVLAAAARPVKAILCEKPIALSLADGERMVAACREKGVPLFINHMRRFDHGIREMKRRLDEFGPILQAQAVYVFGIYNGGTHLIDLLRFFLGEVVEVAGMKNALVAPFAELPDDPGIDGMLTFESGARASIQALDMKDQNIFEIVLHGRKGRVTLTRFGFQTAYAGLKNSDAYVGTREVDEWHPELVGEPHSFFAPMAEHIIACLDGQEENLSTGEDALAALKTIEALVLSAEHGGKPVRLA